MAGFPKTVIIIAGPTAVGKTHLAISLAKRFQTAIISADSRQCYREMNIGVARPSENELAEVPHYFIASHSIHEEVSAAVFENYALQKAQELFVHHDVVIMVGGTGLYIQAFCEGMDAIPPVPASIRKAVSDGYTQYGLGWLQDQLIQRDVLAAEFREMQNPQRVMRALEVILATGQSIRHFQKGEKTVRPFGMIKVALTLPREELYQRINIRVDNMINAGLLEEVKQLWPYRHLNALQTVGYQEIFEHLEGKITLQEAADLIRQNSRRYAKRQLTWFKRDPAYQWFHPSDEPHIYTSCVEKLIQSSEA